MEWKIELILYNHLVQKYSKAYRPSNFHRIGSDCWCWTVGWCWRAFINGGAGDGDGGIDTDGVDPRLCRYTTFDGDILLGSKVFFTAIA